ncbi:MAG: hypothetical protein IAF38_16675 [Bacteroidia bacterium]|nr:hypothetical protein [Bacteroidia bacterium]
MKKILPFALLYILVSSFGIPESNAFVKKLHTAYMAQVRAEAGKTFASTMQKNEGSCLVINDPVFDEVKEKGNTWTFKPKNPTQNKYAVCISFIEKDNAKDIMKKIKTAIGKGTSSLVKTPLLVFRKDKIIYTVTYSCDLKDGAVEKLIIDELKKEIDLEKSNDFVVVKCGGGVEVKS